MNDNLFDYLVATDELDEFLGYEPKCPNCGGKLLKIVYGMPPLEIMEQAKRGEVFLGGCCVFGDNDPEYHCNTCRRSYIKDLTEYIEEENNWENEDDE